MALLRNAVMELVGYGRIFKARFDIEFAKLPHRQHFSHLRPGGLGAMRRRFTRPGEWNGIGAYGRHQVEIAAAFRAARHNTQADPVKTRP